jgi:hypothetical protein
MNDLQRAVNHVEDFLDAHAQTVYPYTDVVGEAGPTRLLVSELRQLAQAARDQQRGTRQ